MIAEIDQKYVSQQLGREARGILDVLTRDESGNPQVLLMNPVIDDQPFLTLYWLIDPKLDRQLAVLESNGMISKLESFVADSPELKTDYHNSHLNYQNQRLKYLLESDLSKLNESSRVSLTTTGIGGIRDFSKIKCLHLQYAYHLVYPNKLGYMITDFLTEGLDEY